MKRTYKQYWYTLGAKKHTVKMTNNKVKKASKKVYKLCTFKLTYNMTVNPSKKQVLKMGTRSVSGKLYTQWGFCVVDYKTGMILARKNNNNVKVTYKK